MNQLQYWNNENQNYYISIIILVCGYDWKDTRLTIKVCQKL